MIVRRRNDADTEVGRRVRVRRLEIGFSQEKLADALDLSFQQVQKYEKGANRISAGRLQQIAHVLKVPISYFYDKSVGGSERKNDLFALLESAYALRLTRAFSAIEDRQVRRRVVELVESLAHRGSAARGSRMKSRRPQ